MELDATLTKIKMSEEAKKYEFAYLLKSEEDYKEIIKSVNSSQVKIDSESQLSKIKLAYPIKKETFAYFGYLYLTAAPEDIKKLGDALRSNLEILRFLIFVKPVIKSRESEKFGRTRINREPSEHVKISEVAPRPTAPAVSSRVQNLSNEALEKKLEEILK